MVKSLGSSGYNTLQLGVSKEELSKGEKKRNIIWTKEQILESTACVWEILKDHSISYRDVKEDSALDFYELKVWRSQILTKGT